MYKLYNDDCREVLQNENFLESIKDKKPIIVTDPPFNIGYHYNEYKDKMPESEYYKMLCNIFGNFPFVVIHYPENIYKIAIECGRVPVKVVSWVYNSNTAKQHRDIAFFDVAPDFNKVKQPYKNPNDKRIKALINAGKLGGRLYDWWDINQVKNVAKDKTKHPCQMPAKVMENIIGILPHDSLIIDPFMGSGTTGIACRKYNVDFIGIEKNKEYFEIAKERIENYSNQMTLF